MKKLNLTELRDCTIVTQELIEGMSLLVRGGAAITCVNCVLEKMQATNTEIYDTIQHSITEQC